MSSVLSADAHVGNSDIREWVLEHMKFEGAKCVMGSNKILATTFIGIYSKYGSLERAKEVSVEMFFQDVVSFNAMIMSLTVNGVESGVLGWNTIVGVGISCQRGWQVIRELDFSMGQFIFIVSLILIPGH